MFRQLRVATMCFGFCMSATAFLFTPVPAQAIPFAGNYAFTSGLSGTFTSNGTQLTAWSFSPPTVPILWQNGAAGQVALFGGPQFFGVQTLPPLGFEFINLDWFNSFYSENGIIGGPHGFSGAFSFQLQGSPVPEPTTNLLLATGLLALAGYGWWQRRERELQVG